MASNPSRRSVVAALAAAPIASLPAARTTPGTSPLAALIKAHRAAYARYERAWQECDEIEGEYYASARPGEFLARNELVGAVYEVRGSSREHVLAWVSQSYELARERVRILDRIADGASEAALAAIDAKIPLRSNRHTNLKKRGRMLSASLRRSADSTRQPTRKRPP